MPAAGAHTFAFARRLWYTVYMLSVLSKPRAGYRFYYELFDGENTFGGGVTQEGELVCDGACTQKELMLRTLVFRCLGEGAAPVYTRAAWGCDLARFGFVREGERCTASAESLRLPHDCEEQG